MNNADITNAYTLAPPSESTIAKKINRKKRKQSKLDPEAEMIKKYWAEGRSNEFICGRLRQKGIYCNRSSVWRYLNTFLACKRPDEKPSHE